VSLLLAEVELAKDYAVELTRMISAGQGSSAAAAALIHELHAIYDRLTEAEQVAVSRYQEAWCNAQLRNRRREVFGEQT
jgi:hypothetical protein